MNIGGINSGYINPNTLSKSEIEMLPAGEKKALIRSGQIECPECSSRKYKDGSDEMVSFKSPAHISPQAAGSVVRAHEGEHVANAYIKAAKEDNAKVVNASVSIQTSICPECGRSYVSGGETRTQIKYNSDAYARNAKSQDSTYLPGMNLDAAV